MEADLLAGDAYGRSTSGWGMDAWLTLFTLAFDYF